MTYSTEQRNLLLSFFRENPDVMFSARQIEDALANKAISRSAVYRNLAELESDGKVRRCAKSGSREAFYQYFDLLSCKNHIHLSCTKCGRIFHMENRAADRLVAQVRQESGFELDKTGTTFYGICGNCSTQEER